jgi:hypothetical protein
MITDRLCFDQNELDSYARDRYREWCDRVSDVLACNLTRPLLRVTAETPVRRYAVNFTSDLADTLAEVTHLESLGFEVPEVARNMSREKARLTGLAEALESMLTDYHTCVDELDSPEVRRDHSKGIFLVSFNKIAMYYIFFSCRSLCFAKRRIESVKH